jgi:hypothetical protein
MASVGLEGAIVRAGSAPHSYSMKPSYANKPVVDVSLYDGAIRVSAPHTGAAGAARMVRRISFSASTDKKNTKPPTSTQAKIQGGIASVSNSTWSGRA